MSPGRNTSGALSCTYGIFALRERNNPKIIQYRRPPRIGIGLMIFLIILAYILISVILYFRSGRTEVYEVRKGALTTNTVHKGIALREEHIVYSDHAGTVNYYNKEGDRVAVGSLAYTVDERGQLQERLARNAQEDAYSESDLQNFRQDAIRFAGNFDPASFSSVYDYRSSAVSTVQKLTNRSVLHDIESPEEEGIYLCTADDTGEIVYSMDGCEDYAFGNLTKEDFDGTGYSKTALANGRSIGAGDPVYKVITEVDWSVAIMTDSEEEAEMLSREGFVKVRFLKNNAVSWAQTTVRSDEEGNYFVNLLFHNSMEAFSADRFVDVELILEEQNGLKVPNSAITKGKFFLIPKDFVQQGSRNQLGVMLEIYTENNEKSVQFVATTTYGETEDKYYVDDSVLRAGEIIDKPNSADQFEIGEQVELIGVYYINRGYPDFRQVNILYQNEEYAIVSPNSFNGLQEYDYIVLHADSIRRGN